MKSVLIKGLSHNDVSTFLDIFDPPSPQGAYVICE